MAKFNVAGLDDVEKAFLRRDAAAVEAVPRMLNAGADVLVNGQRAQAEAMFRGDRSTGDLAQSIAKGKVSGDDTEKKIDVWPQGTDRHGVSNATKGFVQQYGRSNMAARPWMTTANEKYADDVHKAMREEWEAAQNG